MPVGHTLSYFLFMLFLPVEVDLMKTTSHIDQNSAAGHSYLMYFLKDSPELNLVFTWKKAWWHGDPYKLRTGGGFNFQSSLRSWSSTNTTKRDRHVHAQHKARGAHTAASPCERLNYLARGVLHVAVTAEWQTRLTSFLFSFINYI